MASRLTRAVCSNSLKFAFDVGTSWVRPAASTALLYPRKVTLLCQTRSAGHSKWQNIRHIKGAKDAQRSRINARIVQDMNVAIRGGNGCDPKFNTKLAHVIERAEIYDVPKLVIANTLKRAKEGKPRTTAFFDVKGPGNCAIIIEAYTENTNKTKTELASILKKHSAKYADGSLTYAFDKKGIIYIPKQGRSVEAAEDLAIEAGAEEVEEEYGDDGAEEFKLVCSPDEIFLVKKMIELKEIPISRHAIEFIPNSLQAISDEAQEMLVKLLDKLDGMEEIVRVYDNVEVPAS